MPRNEVQPDPLCRAVNPQMYTCIRSNICFSKSGELRRLDRKWLHLNATKVRTSSNGSSATIYTVWWFCVKDYLYSWVWTNNCASNLDRPYRQWGHKTWVVCLYSRFRFYKFNYLGVLIICGNNWRYCYEVLSFRTSFYCIPFSTAHVLQS